MGQYYNVYTKRNGKEKVFETCASLFRNGTYDRDYDFFYGMKLTEHSWIGNGFTNYISKYIYKKPTSIAWVGDYSEDICPVYNVCWGDGAIVKPFPAKLEQVKIDSYIDIDGNERTYKYINNKFDYKGKYLVNHTKRIGFKFDDLYTYKDGNYEWTLYPLSLLVAFGNGRGGGDYHGSNMEMIGAWCLDTISIEDKMPKGCYEISTPIFTESYWKINDEQKED